MISYLDRFMGFKTVSTPREMWEIRESATSKKNMTLALRNLLNYYEEFDMIDEYSLAKYRKVLKVVKTNPDAYIPSTEEVIQAYNSIEKRKYRVLFKVLAVTGLRVIESVKLLSSYSERKLHMASNFARYPLYSLRETKRAYYAYMPVSIAQEISNLSVTERGTVNYFRRHALPPKYLRKWNYNFLIMHNVPESVADFIQGRSPVSVGSMHYLAKVKQADYWYAKVADVLEEMFDYRE